MLLGPRYHCFEFFAAPSIWPDIASMAALQTLPMTLYVEESWEGGVFASLTSIVDDTGGGAAADRRRLRGVE